MIGRCNTRGIYAGNNNINTIEGATDRAKPGFKIYNDDNPTINQDNDVLKRAKQMRKK